MSVALIDGTYQINRAVYSDGDLIDGMGNWSGPAYKFLQMLFNFKNLGDLVIVFDHKHSQFRKKIYPEYKKRSEESDPEKAKRKEIVTEAIKHTERILYQVLPNMGIPIVKMPEQEGDDVLYHLSRIYQDNGHKVYVLSDDGDFFQFVQHGINIFQPMKEKHINSHNFEEEIGFKPEFSVLWKAMVGDSSDNIDGVRGVGDKTATKIVNELESPDIMALREWAKNGDKKIHKKVLDGLPIIKRNLLLIDISQVPLSREEVKNHLNHNLEKVKIDPQRTLEIFKTYKFKTLGGWLSYLNQVRGAESVKSRLSV